MASRLRTHAPRQLLSYPDLWEPDQLCTVSAGGRLIAAANRAAAQTNPGAVRQRPYGASMAKRWQQYRCSWIFARTALRDVAPDEVIRVAPTDETGIYRVVERWRYRVDFRNLRELEQLVGRFFTELRRDRARAVFSCAPTVRG